MDTVTIKKRLEFHTQRLDNLYLAYNKLLSGGVKSYRLDDRELTRLDLGKLSDEIKDAEEKVDELTALLNGQSARKAFVYTESAGEHNHQYIHPSPYNLEIKKTMDGSRQIWDEEEKVIGADNSTDHQHKSHVVWWVPAIDDIVICLYLPCFNADGFVLGGIYP